MKTMMLLAILAGLPVLGTPSQGDTMQVVDRLLPKAKSIRQTDGAFSLPKPIVIAAEGSASEITLRTARMLDADLSYRGHEARVSDDPRCEGRDCAPRGARLEPGSVQARGHARRSHDHGTRRGRGSSTARERCSSSSKTGKSPAARSRTRQTTSTAW